MSKYYQSAGIAVSRGFDHVSKYYQSAGVAVSRGFDHVSECFQSAGRCSCIQRLRSCERVLSACRFCFPGIGFILKKAFSV